ncbi:MAG: esterase family protein [Arcicella sp.]|nr:esterase family protein [Arcicella sp.]
MQKIIAFCLFYGIILNSLAQSIPTTVIINTTQLTQIEEKIISVHLGREVSMTLIYPKNISKKIPILIFNDGQDFDALEMKSSISTLLAENKVAPFFCVGIHANEHRLQEYGTASQADYKQRGSKAKLHRDFIVYELLPFLSKTYHVESNGNTIAGLSLGGLSAMDIGWNNPEIFAKIGVFSGSFWWRQKSEEEGYTDENDRIMHNIIRAGTYKKGMKFWFEAGTNDEKSDRNNNGIIDAIEDTSDLISELEKKGYKNNEDLIYEEVENGEHNANTWKKVLPKFLVWAFGK